MILTRGGDPDVSSFARDGKIFSVVKSHKAGGLEESMQQRQRKQRAKQVTRERCFGLPYTKQ